MPSEFRPERSYLHRFAMYLSALRDNGVQTAAIVRFAVSVLWNASPFLSLLLLALGGIGGLVPLLQVWATKGLIDALVHGEAPAQVGPSMIVTPFVATLAPLLPWVGALVGGLVLGNTTTALIPFLSTLLTVRVSEGLQIRVLEKSLGLGLGVFESPDYYDRLQRARRVAQETVVRMLIGWLAHFISYFLGAVIIVGIVASISVPLAMLLVIGSVPIAVLSLHENQEHIRINHTQAPLQRTLAYWRDLSTTRGPAAEVRLFQLGPYLLERWEALGTRLIQELLEARRRFASKAIGLALGMALLRGIVVVGIAYVSARGLITAGTLVGALYALHRFEQLRFALAQPIFGGSGGGIDLRSVPSFLQMPGAEDASGQPCPRSIGRGITLENVTFLYPGASEPALYDVSVHIRPGERLALVGQNGAGKSTLARLVLGLYAPAKGRILVDGYDLRDIDPSAWRARAAAVFQDFMQYCFTARENIGLGDVQHLQDLDKIVAAARRSGAHEVIQRLPLGYETLLGKGYSNAHDLSIGQWQKLAIARAYSRDAQLWVLDEPAASLDALAEQEVYRQFSDASQGRTVLLISHRLGSARLADRIVFLERGRVVQVGSHDDLIAVGGPYAEMYEMQAEWYRDRSA